jgi:hypothetical protein
MWLNVGVRSMQLMEDYLRRRHGPVSPPRYGLADRQPGLQLFAVDAAINTLQRLLLPQEVSA